MRVGRAVEGGEFGRETLKTIGTGAEIAPWFFGAEQTTNLAKEGLKAPLKQTAKMFARGFVEGLSAVLVPHCRKMTVTLGSVAKGRYSRLALWVRSWVQVFRWSARLV